MVDIQSPTAEIRRGKKERKKKKEEETTGREYSGLPCCIGQPRKIAICAPSHKFVELYLLNEGMYRQSEKKLVQQQYLLHVFSQYGELLRTNG